MTYPRIGEFFGYPQDFLFGCISSRCAAHPARAVPTKLPSEPTPFGPRIWRGFCAPHQYVSARRVIPTISETQCSSQIAYVSAWRTLCGRKFQAFKSFNGPVLQKLVSKGQTLQPNVYDNEELYNFKQVIGKKLQRTTSTKSGYMNRLVTSLPVCPAL